MALSGSPVFGRSTATTGFGGSGVRSAGVDGRACSEITRAGGSAATGCAGFGVLAGGSAGAGPDASARFAASFWSSSIISRSRWPALIMRMAARAHIALIATSAYEPPAHIAIVPRPQTDKKTTGPIAPHGDNPP